MKKKITIVSIIGIVTLVSFISPLQASAYSYPISKNPYTTKTNSIGSWTYEYVNGKLTRKFVYTDENTQTNKNTNSTETTSSNDTNKMNTSTSYTKGYWTYEYVNGKLTRKFVYTD
ncbi:hypothetical protein IZY60_14875, partial [Lutibacter sp. B2]|nr:hypothetical protein [Lutibacter sp. B2]